MQAHQPSQNLPQPPIPPVLQNSVVVFSKNYLPLARINISIQEWDWAFVDGAVDLAKHVAILLALVPHVEELAFEADVPEKIPFLG